jgi:hypothetical protein
MVGTIPSELSKANALRKSVKLTAIAYLSTNLNLTSFILSKI